MSVALYVAGTGNTDAAQSFVAEGDGLIGIQYRYTSSASGHGTTSTIEMSIQEDDGSGRPSGNALFTHSESVTSVQISKEVNATFVTSEKPFSIARGQKYWLVWHLVFDAYYVNVGDVAPAATEMNDIYIRKDDAINWSIHSTANIMCKIHQAVYLKIPEDEYTIDETNNKIVLTSSTDALSTTQSFETIFRGMVSYYYGTVTHQQICDALIQNNSGLVAVTHASQDNTYGLFDTGGKSYGKCLRELCEEFETGGTYQDRQHSFAHYNNSGTQTIKFGFRYLITDAAYITLSHGDDSSTDTEVRIIETKLKKVTLQRPTKVTFIGESTAGRPLPITVHDKAVSTNLGAFNPLSKSDVIYDKSLQTLKLVYDAAINYLNKNTTDTWEGYVTIVGVYPDLMEIDTVSNYYGSGKIITLNYSPRGISAVNFKVNKVVIRNNTTQVFITNRDVLAENNWNKSWNKSQNNESFISPTSIPEYLYYNSYTDGAIDTDTLYMALETASGDLTGMTRVLCTKYEYTAKSLNIYHAEFAPSNGYTADGTPIRYIKLYAAKTGGSAVASYDLYAAGPPIRDERFYKWKSQRLIVDFTTTIS